jgi:hypothetical protein
MNRIIFGLLGVGLVAGPLAASAQTRAPDWTDSWKPTVAAPAHDTASVSGLNYVPGGSALEFGRPVLAARDTVITRDTVGVTAAPEIDPTSAGAGLTLLLGGMAIMLGRRTKQRL